jgi:4'-phosphopantetheinyl transferase
VFLVTRALVRTVLSRYRPIAPAAWRFTANAHGRPRINLPGPASRVTFNASHTDGLIAVAVANGRDVGVDVEKPCERHRTPLVQRCFAPHEKLAFAGIEAPFAALRFAEFWTLKESYVKARGLGLTLPLDCCSFALMRDGIAAVLDERTGDAADRWHFAQCRTASGHVLALCVAAARAREVSIIARAVVPFAHDGAIDLPIVRASWAPVAGTGSLHVS